MDEDTEAAAWHQLELEAREQQERDREFEEWLDSIGAGAPYEQENDDADSCNGKGR